jgi:hypothetical protein
MDELKKVEPPDFDEWAKQYVFSQCHVKIKPKFYEF